MSIPLKASQALTLWHRVSLAGVRSESPDLTQRQMAILMTIYLEPPPHTVRGLAKQLDVSKPVITRALDTMGAMKLVSRHRDPRDMRNVVISRTVQGSQFLERYADRIIAEARNLPL